MGRDIVWPQGRPWPQDWGNPVAAMFIPHRSAAGLLTGRLEVKVRFMRHSRLRQKKLVDEVPKSIAGQRTGVDPLHVAIRIQKDRRGHGQTARSEE